MDTYIYKLKFRSPLHISSDPLSLGKPDVLLHSDTLFSAIVNSWINLYDLPAQFFENPQFVISSAFPFYKDTLFIKKPYSRLKINQQEFERHRKKVKKAAFISMSLFEKFAKGEEISVSEKNFLEGGFLSDVEINEQIYSVQERPRSSIPRYIPDSSEESSEGSAADEEVKTEIFYTTAVHFSDNAGLFFFASFENEEVKKQFDGALYLLGDTGIGGNRTNGYGLFEVEKTEKFDNPLESGDYSIALSLYHPKEEEVKSGILNGAHFNVVSRQSWIFSGSARPYRSKRVRMFDEGGIFKGCSDLSGDVPDITPRIAEEANIFPHRIYRYGKIFKFCLPESALTEANDE